MTDTTSNQIAGDTPGRAAVAGGIALAGHAVSLLAAYLAARVVKPSSGGGLEDVAAAAVTFLGTQVVLGLGCLVVSAVVFRKGRRFTGLGLIGGWLLGLLIVVILTGVL